MRRRLPHSGIFATSGPAANEIECRVMAAPQGKGARKALLLLGNWRLLQKGGGGGGRVGNADVRLVRCNIFR